MNAGSKTYATRLGVVLAVIVGAPALAAETYTCEFTRECPTDQLCSDHDPQVIQFAHDEGKTGVWSLTMPDGQSIPFTRMPFKTDDLRAFVSTSIDPGASAVSLLTLFSDGQAILGIHGVFFAPGSVTHLGTCVSKDN